MKQILFSFLIGFVVAASGCSKEEELAGPSMTAVSADPLAVGNSQPTATPAGPPDPATLMKPAESQIDFATAERPTDDNGKTLDDLAYLNRLVFNVNEGRATYINDNIIEFRSDAERLAYEAALAKAREPIKDLEELVRMKVIKSLPAAPAGKRYMINPTTGKVELANL